jgi:hypothetical protein
MRLPKNLLIFSLLVGVSAFGAEKTWVGKISDSKCGAKHMTSGEHGAKMTDRECAEACVKGGAKYVFVRKGKVYNIENQENAALAEHAGHTVKLTGEMTGDTIKVSNIVMSGG